MFTRGNVWSSDSLVPILIIGGEKTWAKIRFINFPLVEKVILMKLIDKLENYIG